VRHYALPATLIRNDCDQMPVICVSQGNSTTFPRRIMISSAGCNLVCSLAGKNVKISQYVQKPWITALPARLIPE